MSKDSLDDIKCALGYAWGDYRLSGIINQRHHPSRIVARGDDGQRTLIVRDGIGWKIERVWRITG